MKWPEEYINQIICGDCLEVMKGMPDNCIDTIITDPPYNLTSTTRPRPDQSENGSYGRQVPFSRQQSRTGFMGKNWDGTGISFDIKLWEEALRIAKPGSTLLCFGGTRTYHRLACAIEDASWILKDCIMWLYGSGFPKATDISKQIDKKAGKERKTIGDYQRPDGSNPRKNVKAKAIWNNANGNDQKVTAPATPEATLWSGWKSHGLKPAYEPILVAMKPNEGSYANNALKWGVAGLNIDGGRIGYLNRSDSKDAGIHSCNKPQNTIYKTGLKPRGNDRQGIKGRYPANVIIDDSLEVKKEFNKYKTSGNSYRPTGSRGRGIINGRIPFNKGLKRKGDILGFNDSGNPSRFFYCAKASKAERDRGCEGLATKQKYNKDGAWNSHEIFSEYRTDPETGELKKRKEADNDFKNNHPTVKPLALMKYLCTLTETPTGGIVLDPFCGSGTTLMACKELKRDYIGIDNNPEYCEIAGRRINTVSEPLF